MARSLLSAWKRKERCKPWGFLRNRARKAELSTWSITVVSDRRRIFGTPEAGSGRVGARPQVHAATLGSYARFQRRNEARASVRAFSAKSSGATRSRRWFTRPRGLSSRLLLSGRGLFPTILQKTTPGAPPRTSNQRRIQGASLASLAIRVSSSSVRSDGSLGVPWRL